MPHKWFSLLERFIVNDILLAVLDCSFFLLNSYILPKIPAFAMIMSDEIRKTKK